jgi:hypothetical protein
MYHKREDDPKSGELEGRGKGLIEVQTMDSGESFTTKASLVASNIAVGMSFCFKYPFASGSFATGGQADKVPRVTTKKGCRMPKTLRTGFFLRRMIPRTSVASPAATILHHG